VSRDTNANVGSQLAEQREQLDRTLAEQREQLDRTLAEQRERTFNERFATAADRLGDDKPAAVRLAGIYAMAGLADDWEDNRQACVDVLCSCLRMPYEPNPGGDAPARDQLVFRLNQQVRHTIINVITAHLRERASTSWQGLDLDFSGARFDGGEFSGAVFSGGYVSFENAVFCEGMVNFAHSLFCGAIVSFAYATFSSGKVAFFGAEFSQGVVSFRHSDFSGCELWFGAGEFSGGVVVFDNVTFSGGLLSFAPALFSGTEVRFGDAAFSGTRVNFSKAMFRGGMVSFAGSEFTDGWVSFDRAEFSGGIVSFAGLEVEARLDGVEDAQAHPWMNRRLAGSSMTSTFGDAKFSGGRVELSRPRDWSRPPIFVFTGCPPAGLELPKGWAPRSAS
jgi:uncharacterized protein YjbI with pentapeptide repeats